MITSKYIERAVDELASLQGVGRKTALRYALDLMGRSEDDIERFAQAIIEMRQKIQFCSTCFNLSDQAQCEVCQNPNREHDTICIVEDIRDIMAIEATQQYKGVYHVLGGKISPMDGIGPSDLKIDQLLTRVVGHKPKEIILALSPTMEGDTTAFYLFRKLEKQGIEKISTLSRGVAVGDELQYADEVTLGRSILHRTPYENAVT